MSSSLSLAVMSNPFLWISRFRFVELLWHCTNVVSLWFFRNGSVLDPDTWGEVSLVGDVCDSTSLLCLNSGFWVLLLVSVVEFPWISIIWVSWGCCQTNSGIGGNLVASRLSIAAPELKCGNFSLNSGMQPAQFHSTEFDCFFVGPVSVPPVFSAGEAVSWLRYLRSSISL